MQLRKLATKAGRGIWALRKKIVEPVLGQIKETGGLRRFLLRGLKKVRAEWALIALTHDLLKISRAQLRSARNAYAQHAPGRGNSWSSRGAPGFASIRRERRTVDMDRRLVCRSLDGFAKRTRPNAMLALAPRMQGWGGGGPGQIERPAS